MDHSFMTREDLLRQMRRRELEVKTRKELIDEIVGLEERLASSTRGGMESEAVTDALREIEDRYRIITENVRLAIFRETIALGEMLLEANSLAAEIFGYGRKDEFLAVKPGDLYGIAKDRIARLAIALAKELEMGEQDVTGIGLAAALHDLGKIYIPQEILKSQEKLSDWQLNVVRDHPEVGFNILKTLELKTPGFP